MEIELNTAEVAAANAKVLITYLCEPNHRAIAEYFCNEYRAGRNWPAIMLRENLTVLDGTHRLLATCLLCLKSCKVQAPDK